MSALEQALKGLDGLPPGWCRLPVCVPPMECGAEWREDTVVFKVGPSTPIHVVTFGDGFLEAADARSHAAQDGTDGSNGRGISKQGIVTRVIYADVSHFCKLTEPEVLEVVEGCRAVGVPELFEMLFERLRDDS